MPLALYSMSHHVAVFIELLLRHVAFQFRSRAVGSQGVDSSRQRLVDAPPTQLSSGSGAQDGGRHLAQLSHAEI